VLTVPLIGALVVASAAVAVMWAVRSGARTRDQVEAFKKARAVTNTWSERPETTPAPLREYLAQQHRREEADATPRD
jgi:hypothetical protein